MSENVEQIVDLSNRVTRSVVAVIDTVASRGGFRGEELATIGQLRDQSITLIQLIEETQSETDSDEDDAE
jgi:hypothetical protein